MTITVEELDLYPTISVTDLLILIFGNRPISEGDPNFIPMCDFLIWITSAVDAREIYVTYPNPYIFQSRFERIAFFQWMHDKKVLLGLEKRGVKIDDALKKAVETSAEIEQTETTPAPSISPATQEESKPLNQKSSKSNKTNMGGISSPQKDKFIKILKDLSRKKLFKGIIKEYPRKKLPYQKQLLENFIDNPEIEIDDNFIQSLYSNEKFKKIYGTTPRNLIERWIPEALDGRKPK